MDNEILARAREKISDPEILIMVASKRSRQLATGKRPMLKTNLDNYLDIALLEIAEGKLSYELPTEEEVKRPDLPGAGEMFTSDEIPPEL